MYDHPVTVSVPDENLDEQPPNRDSADEPDDSWPGAGEGSFDELWESPDHWPMR